MGAWADHDQGIKKNVVGAASFFDHLVAERDAFRIVLLRLQFVKSFIKLARSLLYFEECVSSGSLLLHLWCSRRRCEGTLTSCLDLPDRCLR